MRLEAKLTAAFSITAGYLLAMGIAAIWWNGQWGAVMQAMAGAQYQLDRVAEAAAGFHHDADRVEDHLARLRDIETRAGSAGERSLIAEAKAALRASSAGLPRAVKILDELGAYYRAVGVTGQQRLERLRRRAVTVIIVALIDGILLAVILLSLTRRWVVRPLLAVEAAASRLAAGQPAPALPADGQDELGALARHVNAIAPVTTELRERLEKTERLAHIGESVSFVAQNVSRQITSIRTLAQYEHDAAGVTPDARAALAHIILTAEKLERWVTDMASTTRSLEPLLGRHALEPILHDVVSLLQPLLAERGLTTELQCAESLPELTLDLALIEQALVAILTNAIEASPDGGQIKIDVVHQDGAAEITVTDQGRGMTDETKRRALAPFFTTKRGATGLGLTVAERIARLHHGELRIESEYQHGARVCFSLPASAPAPPS